MQSGDQLTIDTPEQIALELPLAGIGSRFLALTFDTLLQIIVFVVTGILLAVLAPALHIMFGSVSGSLAAAVFIFFTFSLYWGYFAFFEIVMNGQTPGKRHAGIRVIKDTGRPLTVFETIARNLMRAVDGFALYGVGIICMMLNKQHRRLGDYVAGSVVVHDKATAEIRPSWSPAAETSSAIATPAAVETNLAGISADELVLIETYLHRRFELRPDLRMVTAHRIVLLIKRKTGVEVPPGQSDDDFLEAVVRGVRNNARFR